MKRFLTLVILLIALLASAGFALTLFGFQFEFREDAKFDPVAQFVPAKKTPPVFNRPIRKNLRRRLRDSARATRDADDRALDTVEDASPAESSLDGTAPSFDIVSIDPRGTSVIAGHAPANKVVAIYAKDQRVGTAKSDSSGNWVLVTEQPIKNPDAKFTAKVVADTLDDTARSKMALGGQVTAPGATTSASQVSQAGSASTARSVKDVNARMIASLETLIADARTKSDSNADVEIARQAEVSGDQIVTARNPPAVESRDDLTLTQSQSKTKLVPVPIQFVYREATFTSEGERAAQLLLEFLQLAKPQRVGLSGHADERGTGALNLELSRERLENVERYLRDGGYEGELELAPKGETEPFTGIDRSQFNRDDLYQLDRRVELRFDE